MLYRWLAEGPNVKNFLVHESEFQWRSKQPITWLEEAVFESVSGAACLLKQGQTLHRQRVSQLILLGAMLPG